MKKLLLLLPLGFSCGTDGPKPITARTTIIWLFDSYPSLGIPEGDNCSDLGIATVEVDAVGPQNTMMSAQCSDRQVVFMGLDPGEYTMSVNPLSATGDSLVKAPVPIHVTAAETDTSATINIPYDAWTTAYKGSFYFKITWGGMDCSTAMPVVTTQIVTLSEGGAPLTLKNDTGHKVDGKDPETCRGGTQSVEFVAQVPFGPAKLQVDGKDSTDVIRYTKVYDTFVGAGLSNPTIVYDVPGPPDAPLPDAGLYDAPLPDAN